MKKPPRHCAFCDKPAPYGLRFSGLRSQLAVDKRGYLWTCRAHRAEAEKRRAATKKEGTRG